MTDCFCEYCCNFDKEHIGMDGTALCKLTNTLAYCEESAKDCKFFNIPAADVQETLEKQVPKKPILKETKCFDGSTDEFVFVCPVCNRTICIEPEDDVIADYIKEEYPHCHCGQALDWSDTKCPKKKDLATTAIKEL